VTACAPDRAVAYHAAGHAPDRNLVITPAGDSLTAEAQSYVRNYDPAEDEHWVSRGGSAPADSETAKAGLMGRLFAPASSILPLTGNATQAYEVCNRAIKPGCWLFERRDENVERGSYGLQLHSAWMTTWPSETGLWSGYRYSALAKYRALDFWYLNPKNLADSACHRAYRGVGAAWTILRSAEVELGFCPDRVPSNVDVVRTMAFLDASPDVARPQADDPSVPNSYWSSYPYSGSWPRSYVTYLRTQDPAVVDRIVQHIGSRIRPDLVESPYAVPAP
jgi:hypothetical protein